MKRIQTGAAPVEAAGRGLLDRRLLLRTSALVGFFPAFAENAASAEPSQLAVPEWSKLPGSPFVGYGQPSKFEALSSEPRPIRPTHQGQAQLGHRCIGFTGRSPQTVSTSSAVIVVFPT